MKLETAHDYELALAELRRLAVDVLDDAMSPRRAWSWLLTDAAADYVLRDPANAPYLRPLALATPKDFEEARAADDADALRKHAGSEPGPDVCANCLATKASP